MRQKNTGPSEREKKENEIRELPYLSRWNKHETYFICLRLKVIHLRLTYCFYVIFLAILKFLSANIISLTTTKRNGGNNTRKKCEEVGNGNGIRFERKSITTRAIVNVRSTSL